MKSHQIRIAAVSALMTVMCAGGTLTGCTASDANVAPSLEKVHALLGQGDQSGYGEACQYLDQLDSRTRNNLTLRMLKDNNPLVAYMGAERLVRQKLYDEAAPVMVRLIVNGSNGHDLKGRMDADWRQDADPVTWPTMMSKVGRILMVNMESYSPDSRKRAEYFLVTMLKLEVNKPFNPVDAATALTRINRELKQRNG